ncbi:unnamed protein product, partial [Linum tenue]
MVTTSADDEGLQVEKRVLRRGRESGKERSIPADGGEMLMLSIVRIARMMDRWCVV